MFTGIVEEVGEVVEARGDGFRIRARIVLEDARLGDSIAVNGTCLTVTSFDGDTFTVDTVPETLRRTNLGDLQEGHHVNLERALAANGRFGGHVVQGHIEATGTIASIVAEGEAWLLRVDAPPEIMRYVVEKGFIALDGMSLTIVSRDDRGFVITVIPFTQTHTNLRHRQPGDRVNLETDIFAKYVEQLMRHTGNSEDTDTDRIQVAKG